MRRAFQQYLYRHHCPGREQGRGHDAPARAAALGEAKEVLVIGDDMNDLPMIRHFNGHAVANAAPEVRDAASSVFLSVGQMLRERV